jgi:uncharacterized protein YaaQ
MKLVVAIVQAADSAGLVAALGAAGYRSTVVSTTGGFLQSGNSTVLIGVEDEQVDDVVALISANCRARTRPVSPTSRILAPGELDVRPPASVEVGGGVVFVLDVEQFERL